MALQTLTDDGHMEWDCKCGTRNGVHVSHEQVVIHHRQGVPLQHRMVGLPPCEQCGASTRLKVHFTPTELEAPNFYEVTKDDAGNVVSRQRSASYDVALRHMQLIQQMDNLGKTPLDGQVPATGTITTYPYRKGEGTGPGEVESIGGNAA